MNYSELPSFSPNVDKYSFNLFNNILLRKNVTVANWDGIRLPVFENQDPFIKRVRELSTRKILALYDSTSHAWERLNENPSIKDFDFILESRRSIIRHQMEIKGIPYSETINKFNSLWNNDYKGRLTFIADDSINANQRRRLATLLGIPKDTSIPYSRTARSNLVYHHFNKKLHRLAREEKKREKPPTTPPEADPVWRLSHKVYKQYRDGEYLKLPGVHEFDKKIHFLFASKDMILNNNRFISPSKNTRNTSVLREASVQLAKWRNINTKNVGEALMQEIQAAIERIGLHHLEVNTRYKEPFIDIIKFNNGNNLGSLLRIGPILTEKTRAWAVKSGRVRKGFRDSANRSHPDKGENTASTNITQEETFKRINAAYQILQNKEKFRKWVNGATSFSL